MNDQLKKIWDYREISSSNILFERIDSISDLNCYAGVITYTETKFFTLRLGEFTRLSERLIKRFSGVEIQFMPLTSGEMELVILLVENELLDIYTLFIEDLIASLKYTSEIENALTVISTRISYWISLFGKLSGVILTTQQQQGLYGELLILEFLLNKSTNPDKILDSWQAPNGTNQDFYFRDMAIEVKSSISNSSSIKVANEFQLDSSLYSNLFIAFIRMSKLSSGDNTLLCKINDIRSILKTYPLLLDNFNLKLSQLGINAELENEYNKTSYKVRKITFYEVTEEFPKITSSMVDKAVTQISYEISPNECDEFEVLSDIVIQRVLNE